MQVGGLPGIDFAAGPSERRQVIGGLAGLAVQLHVTEQRPPARRGRQIPEDPVTRLVEIAGHLEGQPPAAREHARPAGYHGQVLGDPLQHGVGNDDAGRLARPPRPQVGLDESQPRTSRRRAARAQHRLGRPDHFRRAVHPHDVSAWPPAGQRGGQVTRTAAQVSDETGRRRADPRQQLEERPGPLARETPVLAGIPHCGSVFLDVKILVSGVLE